jgi:hypothetical protein
VVGVMVTVVAPLTSTTLAFAFKPLMVPPIVKLELLEEP